MTKPFGVDELLARIRAAPPATTRSWALPPYATSSRAQDRPRETGYPEQCGSRRHAAACRRHRRQLRSRLPGARPPAACPAVL